MSAGRGSHPGGFSEAEADRSGRYAESRDGEAKRPGRVRI